MDEAKPELTLVERAAMLRDKVSFHNKKAGWKKTYREKFNALVKTQSAKVDDLKQKRNEKNEKAKGFKANRDEATTHYRHAKINNHELMQKESLEVVRLMKKADKCHQKMLKSKSKADAYYEEYMEVMKQIERGEEE